ncbi:MAG: general secretion pathway protein [endosymbiont of Galathealinum brachiosum]|uniref:General secretion pathway protein n=1 Tax=endosymbiont of Galathealinum brachiosum TaxID=2200906 RepID=A0A370DEA7_9GAMM|nr:MAG: general secretion pathway protein [endosymbiont of Galathealinum brachiosum]
MYLEHFGLKRPPFKITPDTSMFYSGNKRGAALEALKYAISSGEGIIKVVGEVGSGKTMLCRMLEVELGDEIEVVYIANPSLSPENILHVIAFELKLDITSESSKLEVMQTLQNYLLEKHAKNKQVVVFVEEAQGMPIETLEEIRLLSNLETNDDKLLQMVLFGQPELDEKLRNNSIRQLKERITQNFYLDPFPARDVYNYLNFRMRAVGYRGPDLFSPKIANNIERKSNGLTRRINILADKSLLAAFSDGGHDIQSKHINLAAKDSDFGQEIRWQPAAKALAAISIILSAIWVGTMLPNVMNSEINSSSTEVAEIPSNKTDIKLQKTITVNKTSQQVKTIAINTQPTSQPEIMTQAIAITPTENILSQRLQETNSWIQNAVDENFTIQLILLDSNLENDALRFLDKTSRYLNLQDVYIYKVSIRGRMFYSVLYSEYTERNQAVNQLQQLPPRLKKSGPYLRTIRGIKADIQKTRQQGNF